MATLTAAVVLAAIEPVELTAPAILGAPLWLIVIGAGVTAIRRPTRLIAAFRARR